MGSVYKAPSGIQLSLTGSIGVAGALWHLEFLIDQNPWRIDS